MDTREKIAPLNSLAALLGTAQWLAVIGLFDPLTAAEARRLRQLAAHNGRRKILVIVLDVENALLSAEARAALIAALREVQLVAIAESERWRSAIPVAADVQIFEDAEGDRARSQEFVQFILERRHSAAMTTGRND